MSKPLFSSRCEQITQAEIRTMSIECEKVRGINLSQGVCDTPVPKVLEQAVGAAIRKGLNIYTRYDGLQELRESISAKLKRDNHIVADPESEIIVSAGSTGSFYCACLALLNPGDEVILFEPFYGYHLNTLEAVEAKASYVKMIPPDWSFSRKDIEKAITSRTRGIMINTPANPSGKVFSLQELAMIGEVAAEHDLWIFTDEIYEYFLYDKNTHISPASIKTLRDRTIMISGFSKTFSITGWRIGYSVCRPDVAQMIGYMNDLVYVCAPSALQYGVAVGLNKLGRNYYRKLEKEYFEKRELICTALSDAGLRPYVPAGAYYVLADVSRIKGRSSKEKAMSLLKETGVASVPGEAFFHKPQDGKDLVRFCFAKKLDVLKEACRRLKRF